MTRLSIRISHLLAATLLVTGCSSVPTVQEEANEEPRLVTPSSPTTKQPSPPQPAQGEKQAMASIVEENAIYFVSGSALVDEESKEKLRRHAAALKESPESIVTLTGHTDDQGSRNYNLAIAEQRTLAVAQLLRSFGVEARQIRRYSAGSEKMPKACRSNACRAKMRRVEITISP